MRRVVFATKNPGKLREIKEILHSPYFDLKSMAEAGVDADVIEDGLTYEENALKKAVEVMRVAGVLTLADDSGLEVDALDKKPGVFSARFLGADTPHTVKCQQLLALLQDVPEERRTARFVCVAAAAFPDGRTLTARGVIEGRIAYEPCGSGGFGYDPIFYWPACAMTMAEIPASLKNQISHRAQALRQMQETLTSEDYIDYFSV